MPFLKRRMEEDEPPRERVERTERIVEEARGERPMRAEPEYTETSEMDQEEPEPPRKMPPAKPTELTMKYSIVEMKEDLAAHISIVNTTAASLERTGMPPHIAQSLTQSLCSANIKRINDLTAVLKQYA